MLARGKAEGSRGMRIIALAEADEGGTLMAEPLELAVVARGGGFHVEERPGYHVLGYETAQASLAALATAVGPEAFLLLGCSSDAMNCAAVVDAVISLRAPVAIGGVVAVRVGLGLSLPDHCAGLLECMQALGFAISSTSSSEIESFFCP